MKAFDILKEIAPLEVKQGACYYASHYLLEIKKGKLRRNSWYYVSFKELACLGEADVVLILGGGDTQWLYLIEK